MRFRAAAGPSTRVGEPVHYDSASKGVGLGHNWRRPQGGQRKRTRAALRGHIAMAAGAVMTFPYFSSCETARDR